MHVHHQPSDIRGLHLIAHATALAVSICLAGLAGFLRSIGVL
ncbi:hypothetical protein [Cellulomonas sp. APG4]|nr:hypothetical protein [Cellulomonas sp. APG4]